MLKVRIYSFGYKKSGVPADDSPNKGGFVFDCRFIYNPGRKKEFASLTGLDKDVSEFLDNQKEMQDFLKNIFNIVKPAVDNYLSRDFTSLFIGFGCTGGQHRSVYASDKLRDYLNEAYKDKIIIELTHKEFPQISPHWQR